MCNLSFGCYLVVVVICGLSRDVSSPQRSTHNAVGDKHHQQGEEVDQQDQCVLITVEERDRLRSPDSDYILHFRPL